MGSLKRKMARNKAKKAKKELKEQLNMFSKLGGECNACQKEYDKTSKEHVTTWRVIVREQEGLVRLYCPECWDKAQNIVQKIEEELKSEQENQ